MFKLADFEMSEPDVHIVGLQTQEGARGRVGGSSKSVGFILGDRNSLYSISSQSI